MHLNHNNSKTEKKKKWVLLDCLLGVDWSVGIIESPDDIVSKPGARYDSTQPCKIKSRSTHRQSQRKPSQAFIPFIQSPGG